MNRSGCILPNCLSKGCINLSIPLWTLYECMVVWLLMPKCEQAFHMLYVIKLDENIFILLPEQQLWDN